MTKNSLTSTQPVSMRCLADRDVTRFAECNTDTVLWKRVPSVIETRSAGDMLNVHPIVGAFPAEGDLKWNPWTAWRF